MTHNGQQYLNCFRVGMSTDAIAKKYGVPESFVYNQMHDAMDESYRRKQRQKRGLTPEGKAVAHRSLWRRKMRAAGLSEDQIRDALARFPS